MWFHLSGITFAIACLASVYLPATPYAGLLIPVWLVPLASFTQASIGWWYFAIHNPSMLRSEDYQFRERMLESTILHYRDNNISSPFPVAELLGIEPGSNPNSQE